MPFFAENYLGNFTIMEFILQNVENMDYLEDTLAIERGTGDSIIKYMYYLFVVVFDPQQDLDLLYTKYTYAQKAMNKFSEAINIGLFSNAFYNNFISKDGKTCIDYFKGGLSKFSDKACS